MKKIARFSILATMLLVLTGCGRSKEQITADTQPLVTQIAQRVFSSAECTKIIDIQKVDGDHYTATAEVEYFAGLYKTKEYLKISIAYDKDQVFVQVIK